jgi:membrane-associated phospholipid phosphatase
MRQSLVVAVLLAAGSGSLWAQGVQPAQPGQQDYERPISWKQLIPNILSDQGAIWSFPATLAQGHNWAPTVGIVGTTAALFQLDPYAARYFHTTSTYSGFNKIFTGNATAWGIAIAPLTLYAVGLIRRDTKMEHTMLLAGEAVADAEILTTVFKDLDRRARPSTFGAHGNYSDSWFDSPGGSIRGSGSFPSGHEIAAFSVATIIARRYRTHRWVPYVAYGLAATVGFSRLTLSAHYVSDVFAGAAFGYVISRYTVLRQ